LNPWVRKFSYFCDDVQEYEPLWGDRVKLLLEKVGCSWICRKRLLLLEDFQDYYELQHAT